MLADRAARRVANKKPLRVQRWWDSRCNETGGFLSSLILRTGACLERQRRAVAGFGTKHGSDENRRLPGFKGPYPSTALDKRAGLFTCAAVILSGSGEVVKSVRGVGSVNDEARSGAPPER